MTLQERYKVLSFMTINHMRVAQMGCGCCLHPALQVDMIGNQQKVSLVSSIRKMVLCRDHQQNSKQ